MKTWVEISRSALRENVDTLRKVIGPSTKLMAVVKANAYGHGLETVVPAIRERVDWFGVVSVGEADRVRALAPSKPILVMGYATDAELGHAIKRGFRITLHSPNAAKKIMQLATAARPARVHLKIETGISRLGFLLEDLPALIRTLAGKKQVVVEGASTHFANIEDSADLSYGRQQLDRFRQGLAILKDAGIEPALPHIAASGAAMIFPESRLAMVRTGIAMYGLWPSENIRQAMEGQGFSLRPALAWKCRIAQIKHLPAGTPVSYGLTERLGRDSTLAVLPIGYWDGLPRAMSSVGEVLVNGHRAKIIGRVCMNMCIVDVTEAGAVAPGDEAVLIGRQGISLVSADEFAAKHGTINYEVVTRINPSIQRLAKP
ncbi:MAG: alanine racemase [Patescibacteria group bacterium]